MRIIYMILSGALLTSCAAPCPVVQPRYTCPPELGTTWQLWMNMAVRRCCALLVDVEDLSMRQIVR